LVNCPQIQIENRGLLGIRMSKDVDEKKAKETEPFKKRDLK